MDLSRKNKFLTLSWQIPIILSAILIFISQYNFLLFHTLAEFFAIIVAILMTVVAWQMYPFTKNNFLMFLGCGYFWIACMDLMHTISYKGINILPIEGANTSTQLWILTRYTESIMLLIAPWFLTHKLNRQVSFYLFSALAIAIVYLVLQTSIFPDTYIEGVGLTEFKVYSEYFIIVILISAVIYLYKQKHYLDKNILNYIIASVILTMCAELAFTFYISVYGISNITGHIFKLFSFWLIFIAMIKSTLQEPFAALSRDANTYEVIPNATVVIDDDGIIRQANTEATNMSGMDKAELIGRNNHVVFHNQDIKESECIICQATKDHKELHMLEQEIEKDKWFDFTTSFIDGVLKHSGSIQVIRDISERKKSEKKYNELDVLKNSIVENLPAVLFVKDADELRYVEWNKAAEELVGFSKNEMLGFNDFDFWPDKEAEFFTKKDREVLSSGRLVDIPEEIITTREKGERILHTRKIPILNQQGKPKFLLGISEDITDVKQNEEMLRQSQKMEAIGQLSGGIAHDFNNQLGVVIGYLELLADDFDKGDKKYSWIQAANKAALHCIDLTSQLLLVSRKKATSKIILNINELFNELKIMIEKAITPEISVEYDLADNLWDVEVNKGNFQDVILNLTLNARDAISGSGILKFHTENIYFDADSVKNYPDLVPGEYVKISVSDSGKGIDDVILNRVFEPFFTTKNVGEGTGLGLSMVYGFTRQNKGTIEVFSTKNTGTTFNLYIPRSVRNENHANPEQKNSLKKTYEGNESILIVDDEKELVTLATYFLSGLGYKIYQAYNANEALEILNNHDIDLVFTDIIMPGELSGFDLLKKVIELDKNIKMLATSGYTKKIKDTEFKGRGDYAFISKPYNKEDAAELIRNLLNS